MDGSSVTYQIDSELPSAIQRSILCQLVRLKITCKLFRNAIAIIHRDSRCKLLFDFLRLNPNSAEVFSIVGCESYMSELQRGDTDHL